MKGWAQRATTGVLAMLLVASLIQFASPAGAQSSAQPANKATAAAADTDAIHGEEAILSATMKTSKPTDLIATVSLECAILTKLYNQGGPNNNQTSSEVTGAIDIYLTQTSSTGAERVVPIVSTSQPPQDGSTPNSGDPIKDSVTFCRRHSGQRITDAEENEGVDPANPNPTGDGTDSNENFQDTKEANSFTWILLNAGSDTYTYTVHARYTDNGANGCTATFTDGPTCSRAIVGKRILVLEPTKMANNAVVSNPGYGG